MLKINDNDERWDVVPLQTFYESGLLRHVNATILWPLGLALTISRDREGGGPDVLMVQDAGEPIVTGLGSEDIAAKERALADYIAERQRLLAGEG